MKPITLTIFFLFCIFSIQCFCMEGEHCRVAEAPQVTKDLTDLPGVGTKRLRLEMLSTEHLEELFKVHSNLLITKYIPVNLDESIEDTNKWFGKYNEKMKQGKAIYFAIILRRKNKVIGRCGLFKIDCNNGSGESVMVIHPDYWRQGYAYEAGKALCKIGFEKIGLNKITATAYPENTGSIKLSKKVGFTIVGFLKEHYYHADGRYCDRTLMELLKADFFKKHNSKNDGTNKK